MKNKNLSNKNEVVIAFITDDNYVMPTVVAITSAIMNKNEDSIYKISVIGISISEENKVILDKFVNKNIKEKISIKNLYFSQNYSIKPNTYVTSSAIFKFDIPNILEDCDKVLYLDSDTIILKDLSEFFNLDIKDYYASAVKDYFIMETTKQNKDIGVEDYFNSGVMLLNAKLLREDNVRDKLLDYRNRNYNYYMDQDAFNYIFNNRVKFVSPKYNYMVSVMQYTDNKILSDFYQCDIEKEEIVVMHFAGFKPFRNEEYNFSFDYFYDYYQYTNFFKDAPIKTIRYIMDQKLKSLERVFVYKHDEQHNSNIELNNRINELKTVINNLEKENKDRYSANWIKFFGIYNNNEYIFIYLFFIKFTIRMSEKSIKNISWWIPVKKWRENFRNKFRRFNL